MVLMFMFYAQLGLDQHTGVQRCVWHFGFSAIWYFIAKSAQKSKGINVDFAFKEIPPE